MSYCASAIFFIFFYPYTDVYWHCKLRTFPESCEVISQACYLGGIRTHWVYQNHSSLINDLLETNFRIIQAINYLYSSFVDVTKPLCIKSLPKKIMTTFNLRPNIPLHHALFNFYKYLVQFRYIFC